MLLVGVDGERGFFCLPVLLGDTDGESISLPLLLDGVHRGTGETETVGVRVIIPKGEEDLGLGVGAKPGTVTNVLLLDGDEVAAGMIPAPSFGGLAVTGIGMDETVGCIEGANPGTTVGRLLLMGDEEITEDPVFPMHFFFPTHITMDVVPLIEFLVEVLVIVIFVEL